MHLSEAALLEGKEAQVKGTSAWSQFYLPVLIQAQRPLHIPIYC